ncbi:MAG: glycosyltransferase family 2 protein [Lachnospiraceae bacterium]|nr:glycosyltransferase family 2 protein [Lachnospiraceae bacterium]
MKLSVVIPNYNGEEYLRDCLEALSKQTMSDFDIIIVDNGSTDRSLDTAREVCPDAVIIMLDRNYGFSRAVNEGIRASDAPYVILLNNDTKVLPDFVSELYNAIRSDEKIFSVSSKMIQMKAPDLMDSAGDMYCCLGWAFARGKDRKETLYNERTRIFSACAGAAIYRKKIFEEIGYFDEAHFAYLEDVDVGYRAMICGYRNIYEPAAVVHHLGSGMSGSRYNKFKISLSSRNNVYLAYKNMPLLQLVINLPFLIAGYLIKTVFFIRKGEGVTYVKGLIRGLSMCRRDRKFPYRNRNLLNYIRIQIMLFVNVIYRIKG